MNTVPGRETIHSDGTRETSYCREWVEIGSAFVYSGMNHEIREEIPTKITLSTIVRVGTFFANWSTDECELGKGICVNNEQFHAGSLQLNGSSFSCHFQREFLQSTFQVIQT